MYQISELLKFTKLFHSFSEKSDGNMGNAISGKIYKFDQVVKCRKKFLRKINVSLTRCVCMWVMHGDEMKTVEDRDVGKSMLDREVALRLDGLITNRKGIYLFLNIADCLPIILYDPIKEVVGLIHAGWKGVDLEIVKKALRKIQDGFGSSISDIVVGIGPCARKENFIKENPDQKDDPRWQPFLNKVGVYHEVDLVGFVKKQLADAGVLENSIFDCGIDTVKDERFFSHVREKDLPLVKQGRFACLVGLK